MDTDQTAHTGQNMEFHKKIDQLPLEIQNGQFHACCFKMYGIIHQHGMGL